MSLKRLTIRAVISSAAFIIWLWVLGLIGSSAKQTWETWVVLGLVGIPIFMMTIPMEERWKRRREQKKRFKLRGLK